MIRSDTERQRILEVFRQTEGSTLTERYRVASDVLRGEGIACLWRGVQGVVLRNSMSGVPKDGEVYHEQVISDEGDGQERNVTTKSLNIQTLEQLIAAAGVDRDIWEVQRWEATSWEVTVGEADGPVTHTNFRVFASFKRRIPELLDIAINSLIKRVEVIKPRKVPKMLPVGEYAQEICPFDVHIGKLAWGEETGQGNMDVSLASKWFVDTVVQNLQYGQSFNPSKIFFVLGQDLMHYENYLGTTAIGQNELDIDGRLQKTLTVVIESCYKAILSCAEVAPTEVIWVPGNHDAHASLYLSHIIKARFHDHKWIEVDNDANWRKARLWGNLLVAWTHDASGGKEKATVNMLPQYWPKMWGKSVYREWHTGHKHKANETKYSPTVGVGGIVIKQLAALSKIDAWHYQNGFVDAVPACNSFIWTKDKGVCAEYSVKL